MFYTIYRITNLIDGKIYIGKHQTKDLNDGYMGSGKHLKRAIVKHGIENFKKEILFQFDNEADMNAKEAELVTEEFCLREDTYNLCPGGNGGFGYLNSSEGLKLSTRKAGIETWNKTAREIHYEKLRNDSVYYEEYSLKCKVAVQRKLQDDPNAFSHFAGKTHSDEAKTKMSNKKIGHTFQSGSKNSQFGTMWITNGQENKKIKKDVDFIPEGWYKGYRPKQKNVGK